MGLALLRAIALSVLVVGCGGGGGGEAPDGGDAANGDDADTVDGSAADASAAEPDAGAEMFDAGATQKIVFVTSSTHSGDLNGPDGADGICGARAEEGGLAGTFKAWVSGATSASARLAHFDGPYLRTDGTQVADDWDDLTDGSLDASMSRDENGDTVDADVWTGTTASGAADAARCLDFESGFIGEDGLCGSTTATNGTWSDNIVPPCNTPLHVYCIEQ